MTEFEWPWQYSFPPFYTLQPNLATQSKQMECWCSMILQYCKSHSIYQLNVTEAHSSQLFHNKDIHIPLEVVHLVLEELRKTGNLEWLDNKKEQCLIFWRTPKQWATLLYNWASEHGMVNTVCTLYELTSGDDTTEEEFYGLDQEVLLRAIQCLEDEGKGKVITVEDSQGVKFF